MLTPEQLLLRNTGIGGSDAAAIVGLGKYATPLDVYLDKTTDTAKETTEIMARGNVLEPFVQSLFERKTGWRVQSGLDTQRNSEHPFMLANLDGVLPSERALVEFKTALYTSKTKEGWGEEETDEIPSHYLIQVAHYASVMEADTVHIGVLFGDEKLFHSYRTLHTLSTETGRSLSADDLDVLKCDFRLYTYKRHADLTRKLINKERSFWFDHVLKKNPPDPQDGNVDDFLKAYPITNDRVVSVSDADLTKIQRLNQIKHQIKELETLEEEAKADVLKLFGEASLLVDSYQTPLATWKNKSTTRFDKTSFAKAHPDLCSTFTQTAYSGEFERQFWFYPNGRSGLIRTVN
ncbi:YqaJ viral recombinase family protein, partial [Candidatus Finniella inopinata]